MRQYVIEYFMADDHATDVCGDLEEIMRRRDFIETVGWVVAEDEIYFYICSGTVRSKPEDYDGTMDITRMVKRDIVRRERVGVVMAP